MKKYLGVLRLRDGAGPTRATTLGLLDDISMSRSTLMAEDQDLERVALSAIMII